MVANFAESLFAVSSNGKTTAGGQYYKTLRIRNYGHYYGKTTAAAQTFLVACDIKGHSGHNCREWRKLRRSVSSVAPLMW